MKEITLSDGHRKALVDDEDYDKVRTKSWTSYKKLKHANARIYARGSNVDLHRFVLSHVSSDYIVRFKNGNTLDCRKENLLIVGKGTGKVFDYDSTIFQKPSPDVLPVISLDNLPPVKQFRLNNKFIGVYPDLKNVTKLVDGEIKQVTETRYISKYVGSDNREYVFGKFKTPEEAATVYNKQVKLLAHSLKEDVELNVFE